MDRILIIDSSNNRSVKVGLRIEKKEAYIGSKTQLLRAQAVLPLIDKILKEHGLKISDIEAIEVNTGPGSFTGLRVGISVVNALGFALNIPVNKKKTGEIVTPTYEARPQ